MISVKILDVGQNCYWWIEEGNKATATGGKDFASAKEAEQDAIKRLGEVRFNYEPKPTK